ncbi:MAG TPA: hypothetical protein VGB42_02025 [Candidatus Thermoplasmatota archaeon]
MRAAQSPLDVEKVLLAIDELRRWEERRAELSRGTGGPEPSPAEWARVRQQILYYGGLLQDMKRRAHPDSVPRFIGRLTGRGAPR